MRLINVATGRLEEPADTPKYAILSHTWGGNELTFEDLAYNNVHTQDNYYKIRGTIEQARLYKIQYIWIDTCCIDKRSSAELSEAINSMFQWYKDAQVCFTYLEDLDPDANVDVGLKRCRWFQRGWTLQELIAPKDVLFFDRDWNEKGTKVSLQDSISGITGIRKEILLGTAMLGNISAAEKMSWAASRETTRLEDMAYSLLGIFEVNMALIYGEGPKAFTRLQEEIIKHTNDLSILAWDASAGASINPYCGILAESPKVFDFLDKALLQELSDSTASRTFVPEFAITNRGLRITTELLVSTDVNHGPRGYFLCLSNFEKPPGMGIYLRKVGLNSFVRLAHMRLTGHVGNDSIDWVESLHLQTIYIATSAPGASFLDDTVARYPPIHFPVHPYIRIEATYPRASWDVFYRMFHTGMPSVSGFFGVVCCQVFNDRESGGPRKCVGRVGIIIQTLAMKCRVFNWESSPQEIRSIMFDKGPSAGDFAGAFQAQLVRFYHKIPPVESVYWEAGADGGTAVSSFRRRCEMGVCAWLTNGTVMAISGEPVVSVHMKVSCKDRSGLRVGSWTTLR